MKKILFDCIVSHYQPPLILSPPIDRWPKKLENRTHVLADRILRDFRILRVQQEENVASEQWKIKELQSCTESCLSNPVLHLALLMPVGLHYRLGILHGGQTEVAHDIKQCDVIAENNQQGIATTNNT